MKQSIRRNIPYFIPAVVLAGVGAVAAVTSNRGEHTACNDSAVNQFDSTGSSSGKAKLVIELKSKATVTFSDSGAVVLRGYHDKKITAPAERHVEKYHIGPFASGITKCVDEPTVKTIQVPYYGAADPEFSQPVCGKNNRIRFSGTVAINGAEQSFTVPTTVTCQPGQVIPHQNSVNIFDVPYPVSK